MKIFDILSYLLNRLMHSLRYFSGLLRGTYNVSKAGFFTPRYIGVHSPQETNTSTYSLRIPRTCGIKRPHKHKISAQRISTKLGYYFVRINHILKRLRHLGHDALKFFTSLFVNRISTLIFSDKVHCNRSATTIFKGKRLYHALIV